MKIRLYCVSIALAFLASCVEYSTLTRFNSNYFYEGKTYAVYTAERTERGRTTTVFLLGEELDDAGRPKTNGIRITDAKDAFAVCTSSDIRDCEKTFGAVLRRIETGAPARDEGGGMGY